MQCVLLLSVVVSQFEINAPCPDMCRFAGTKRKLSLLLAALGGLR